MTPIKINYQSLRPGDVFLSHGRDPVGRIIRIAQTMKINPADKRTPTHAGVIVNLDGQFFACEMKPRLSINSLEKYTGKTEQIVAVYRPMWYDDEEICQTMQRRMMLWIRKNGDDIKYDPLGAILSSPLGNKLIGWIPGVKNSVERRFCSEHVCDTLKMAGDILIPGALSPYELEQWFKTWASKYKLVKDWKIQQEKTSCQQTT